MYLIFKDSALPGSGRSSRLEVREVHSYNKIRANHKSQTMTIRYSGYS